MFGVSGLRLKAGCSCWNKDGLGMERLHMLDFPTALRFQSSRFTVMVWVDWKLVGHHRRFLPIVYLCARRSGGLKSGQISDRHRFLKLWIRSRRFTWNLHSLGLNGVVDCNAIVKIVLPEL